MLRCDSGHDGTAARTLSAVTIPGDRGLTARFRHHRRLAPALPDDVLVSVSVGPSGEAVAMWAAPADRRALLGARGAGVASPSRPVAVRVGVSGAGTHAVAPSAALGMAFCQAQPLPDGHALGVAARGGAAAVFDADGEPVRQADVGDGVEHVRTTRTGRCWIGYFDEGVYGGDPVAHHGIVRFTDELEPDWMYPFDTGFGPVDDCYALNVDGETAWSCYYSGFPIVRLGEDTLTGWHNPDVQGATALAADADRCALVGGYGEAGFDRLVIGRLADRRYRPTGEGRLTLPDGRPVPPGNPIVGSGAELHLFVHHDWYRLGLDDLG